ncbi:MAG: hypothetical protein WBM59_12470, partial [Sedimenticolaceae bacterium]
AHFSLSQRPPRQLRVYEEIEKARREQACPGEQAKPASSKSPFGLPIVADNPSTPPSRNRFSGPGVYHWHYSASAFPDSTL